MIPILLPIVVEIIRKYLFFSRYFLGTFEISLFVYALYISTPLPRKLAYIYTMFLVSLFYGLVQFLFNDSSFIQLTVGLRPVLGFCSGLLIGFNLIRKKRYNQRKLHFLLSILFLISAFAILQIISGSASSIALVQNQEALGVQGGIGLADGYFLGFRPSSIFMNTGKFGQFSFFFGLLCFSFYIRLRDLNKLSSPWASSLLVIGVWAVALVVSGQKFALVGFSAFLFILVSKRKLAPSDLLNIALMVISAVSVLLVYDFNSIIDSISTRFLNQNLFPMLNILEESSVVSILFGHGLGSGGQSMSITSDALAGLVLSGRFAESSVVKLFYEAGIVGLMAVTMAGCYLILRLGTPQFNSKAYPYIHSGQALSSSKRYFFLVFMFVFVFVWGSGHDIVSNFQTMFYLGIALSFWSEYIWYR